MGLWLGCVVVGVALGGGGVVGGEGGAGGGREAEPEEV